jgi:hypothetical protein
LEARDGGWDEMRWNGIETRAKTKTKMRTE